MRHEIKRSFPVLKGDQVADLVMCNRCECLTDTFFLIGLLTLCVSCFQTERGFERGGKEK